MSEIDSHDSDLDVFDKKERRNDNHIMNYNNTFSQDNKNGFHDDSQEDEKAK